MWGGRKPNPAGLRIEAGIVVQYINDYEDDLINYTFQINFVWGGAFKVNFLKPIIERRN